MRTLRSWPTSETFFLRRPKCKSAVSALRRGAAAFAKPHPAFLRVQVAMRKRGRLTSAKHRLGTRHIVPDSNYTWIDVTREETPAQSSLTGPRFEISSSHFPSSKPGSMTFDPGFQQVFHLVRRLQVLSQSQPLAETLSLTETFITDKAKPVSCAALARERFYLDSAHFTVNRLGF
jgi:hypothetical protein